MLLKSRNISYCSETLININEKVIKIPNHYNTHSEMESVFLFLLPFRKVYICLNSIS